jgi:hypothetical protein
MNIIIRYQHPPRTWPTNQAKTAVGALLLDAATKRAPISLPELYGLLMAPGAGRTKVSVGSGTQVPW